MYSPADVADLVGPAAFARGSVYVAQERIRGLATRPASARIRQTIGATTQLVAQVIGTANVPYIAIVNLANARGELELLSGECTCPVGSNCKHVAATLLRYLDESSSASPSSRGGDRRGIAAVPANWEDELSALTNSGRAQVGTGQQQIGLQVEVSRGHNTATMYTARRGSASSTVTRVGLRPLTRGRSGRWIRTGISWQELSYQFSYRQSPELNVLRALYALAVPTYQYTAPAQIWLNDAPGSAVWSLLVQAAALGVAFVDAADNRSEVLVVPGPVSTETTVAATGEGALEVATRLVSIDGEIDRALADGAEPIGVPAHGIVTVLKRDGRDQLALVPTAAAIDQGVLDLIARPAPITIPAAGLSKFYATWLPAISARVDQVSFAQDAAGAAPTPVLTLLTTALGPHRVMTTLRWRYVSSGLVVADYPFALAHGQSAGLRDLEAQALVWADLGTIPELADIARQVENSQDGAWLTDGIETATLLATTVPRLRELTEGNESFRIEQVGDIAEYRVTDALEVSVSSEQSFDRDWFSLNVRVHVAGREVPLSEVFAALVRDEEYLLLDDGTMAPLTDPRLEQLREAIESARLLQDERREGLRVGRYQVRLFQRLDELGLLGEEAVQWRGVVASLDELSAPTALAAPPRLNASLRGYQQHGYEWLSYRVHHGLGGILADDMGLGKTLQTLAMIDHELSIATEPKPFLVVAPTSVVGNWASEAAKFAPHLRTVTIDATAKRRGESIGSIAGRADIVVTSYALFRLENDAYAATDWAALILDEAQFVKNHQSVGYRSAKDLPTPVKIALTGTPLENNLMELWAIMSIVCPGLLPDAKTFTAKVERPIARGQGGDLIERLRSVIAPFVLRRTKEVVAADLPAKQENITEVTLNQRHRKVYDQYLQRERSRVLGLVDELDNHRIEVLRSLSILRQASLDVSLVDEAHASIGSSKLEVLFDILDEILADGHNVLIFSQFTRFLGKVRDRLIERGVEHAYLDGRTRRRAEQIEKFSSGEASVFLISLKAGGFGLNLTAADYCILLDPWWNPAAEAQAVDRAHRIGQTRQVMVYRLVSQNTIEEKVMALKREKSALFSQIIDGGDAPATSRVGLTADDIKELLA
ncbi:DEAD/DEAH box helicase [Rarobacter faecitabidus]|uniref:Helicase-like protein n=1 Tax=Rarobacter faecitabidus TaxID=13243 RepID=A0A542ZAM0_RARFA|nr:DEAD/DEAH box helicase [Rarobacter faecitabidus]TQL57387.1 helicase-like protein [Rarobacter faecitabidus]